MALLRVWAIVPDVSWPELYVENWKEVAPTMQLLGIKGGHQKAGDPATADQVADDGKLMVETGKFLEEWDVTGLRGVHLIWNFMLDNMKSLIEMMSVDSVLYDDLTPAERKYIEANYVPGQRRMVAVVCPALSRAPSFWTSLASVSSLSEGSCALHFMAKNNRNSNLLPSKYGQMFGGLFESASFLPNGKTITVPNGASVETGDVWDRPGIREWLHVVGFELEDVCLSGPLGVRNRRALSLASTLWASRNWNDDVSRLEIPPDDPDWAVKVAEFGAIPEVLEAMPAAKVAVRRKGSASPKAALGDMIACNSCTLFDQCRLARVGAICTLRESDMGELAEFFKTRDANRVIEGLGQLLGKQADRVEAAMADEAHADPEEAAALRDDVTKMIHGLFDRGAKLAMLNDPRLKGGPQVQVSLTNNAVGQITQGSPQQLAAGVVAELEARGVRREDITPELIARELGIGDTDVVDAVVVPADPVLGSRPEAR